MSGEHQRRELPEGTVTLLFADVEGSTRLLYALGERFTAARARLRQVVRDAAARNGGHEVDWAGDGAFLAFAGARDALAAAAEIQRTLADEPWADHEALRLRVGIHTGEPRLADEGYIGPDVVVAARICSSCHGEQVVVSRATRDVSGDAPLAGASFRPLGRHRLKDIPSAEYLFQLVAPGLRAEFPPLRTLGATSLPALHHRLVGRGDALQRIHGLLRGQDVRLVTITGPGGAGKSRLALEVAASAALERPVHLVALAPVAHADLVPGAIARVLGVRESANRPLLQAVADALDGTNALLFLDNLEHLAPAAVHVAELLDRVPGLDVLATSRAPLQLSGEHVLPLEPLTVDDAATLLAELAAARGVVLQPDTLASVHEICRRLDGLPLAIELVAARLVVLPPAEILRALDEGLALEMEGPVDLPERQRTLRAALDWSYGLLSESQRELHGALAVFVNGCTLEDARSVARTPARLIPDLEALVAWSLVRSEAADGDLRLAMLETVREHALDRVRERGSLDELRDRHAERFLELAFAAQDGLTGPDQAEWLVRLERELDNIGAALDWSLSAGRVEVALRAISDLERFWRAHAHVTEARRRLARALQASVDAPPEVRANALRCAGHMAMGQSDWTASVPLLEEAIELCRATGRYEEEVLALGYLSFVALRIEDVGRARALAAEALDVARSLGSDRALTIALAAVGDVAWVESDHEHAIARYEEAVALSRRVGDPLLEVDTVYHLGMAAFQGQNLVKARAAFDEALDLAHRLDDMPHLAAARFMLGELEALEGDASSAGRHAHEAFALYTELEDDRSRARCLVILAAQALAEARDQDSAMLLGAAETLRGDDPPDAFEAPILDRLVPELESALGGDGFAAARLAGVHLGPKGHLAGIATASTRQ